MSRVRFGGLAIRVGVALFLAVGVDCSLLTVHSASAAVPPLAITTSSLPASIVGDPYSATLQATGGTAPYKFGYLQGGSLPRGIHLSNGGVLSGTSRLPGVHVVKFWVRDASKPKRPAYAVLTIDVAAPNGIGCTYIGEDAIWIGCNFSGADLEGYNLTTSQFENVNFTDANLSHAELAYDSFSGSDLTGTNFTGSDLTGAVFFDVTWNDTTCPDGTNSNTDQGTCANNLG